MRNRKAMKKTGAKKLFFPAVLAALALSLSACGGSAKEETKAVPETSETTEAEEESIQERAMSTEQETPAETVQGTLSPFQNFMESSIEQKANETTLSNQEKESIQAAEKASRDAAEASLAAAEAASRAQVEASLAAEESIEASIDQSIAEAESIAQSIEESQAEEEMRLMNESADAEAASIAAENGPGFDMTKPTAESPAAPGA